MSQRSGFHPHFLKTWPCDLKTWPKKFYKVVLESRDIKDTTTIFGFYVSNHKKKCWAFEIFLSKFFFWFKNISAIFGARDLKFLPKVKKKYFTNKFWKKMKKKQIWKNFEFFFEIFFFEKKNVLKFFLNFFFQIHKIYHLGLLCTNFQCSGIILFFFKFAYRQKSTLLFLWWDTKNLKILDEYLWSLVFKIMWTKFLNLCIVRFSVRFSKNVAKTWPNEPENLNLKILFTWF